MCALSERTPRFDGSLKNVVRSIPKPWSYTSRTTLVIDFFFRFRRVKTTRPLLHSRTDSSTLAIRRHYDNIALSIHPRTTTTTRTLVVGLSPGRHATTPPLYVNTCVPVDVPTAGAARSSSRDRRRCYTCILLEMHTLRNRTTSGPCTRKSLNIN